MNWLILAQSAVEVPGPAVDPNVATSGFVEAISSHQWGLVIGFGLMLIVWGLRLAWPKLNSKYLPWIAVAIGGLGATGTALAAEPQNWISALLAGVSAGLSAAGTWGLLGAVRKKKIRE